MSIIPSRASQLELRQRELEELIQSGDKEAQSLLVSKTKLQVALDAVSAKAEVFEMRWEDARWDLIEFRDKAKRAQEQVESSLAVAKLEVVELKVELVSVRSQVAELQENQTSLRDGSKRKQPGVCKKLKDSDQELEINQSS